MTYKILHFADLHLDTSFAGQGFSLNYGIERRLDLRGCMMRIFARAKELKVDAITIGGDLFDQEYLLPETANFIQQQFALLAPIRIIIVPGIKDQYTSDSPYARLNWSENVNVFNQRKLTSIELFPDIHIWGACNPPPLGRKLLDDYKPASGVNILLLHGCRKLYSNDIYTINDEIVKLFGFDIALLGGEHLTDISPTERPVCIYPGTPEPLNQGEENSLHQVALLEITGQNINTHSDEIRLWHYRVAQIDISNYSSNVEIAQQISNLLENENKRTSQSAITIELKGRPQFGLKISNLCELIQSSAFYRLEVHFEMSYNIEQLATEQTVRGLLVQHFLERIHKSMNESERNRELTALNIALQALEGKQVCLYEIKTN